MRRTRRIRTTPALLVAGLLSALIPLISGSREERGGDSGTADLESKPQSGAPASSSPGLSGKVIRVLDGDTIEILKVDATGKHPVRIRMTGIDAPEKSQPFGEKCRETLASLVAGKNVRVDLRGNDRYSRSLGVILVPASSPVTKGQAPSPAEKDANLEQIAAGCAWHYKQYQKQQKPEERRRYSEAEDRARAAKLGLWRDPEPVAPWDFRRESRGSRQKGRSR
jgi:endonuclease YncB( thermonuclease family)